MNPLLKLRNKIDEIDNQIIALLKQRSLLIPTVKEIKKDYNQKIAFAREIEIYNNLLNKDCGLYSNLFLQKMWREIIGATLKIENSINIGIYNKNYTILQGIYELAKDHFGVSANIKIYKSRQLLKQHILNKTLNCAIIYNNSKEQQLHTNSKIKVLEHLPYLVDIQRFNNKISAIIIGLSN